MPNKPANIQIVEEGRQRLIMERRWLSFRSLGILIFATIWNVFLVFYTLQVQRAEDPSEAFLLIPLSIVGLIAVYLALATLLNRTRFTVDMERITVTHAPLPWKRKSVERSAIQQILANEFQTGGASAGSRRLTYAVSALLHDGTQKRLAGDLKNGAEALFIRQTLNRHLNIDRPPVAGEYQSLWG